MKLPLGFLLLYGSLLFLGIDGYIVQPGPLVHATYGEVWPKPQLQQKTNNYFVIRPQNFNFKTSNSQCTNFLENAFKRYWDLISSSNSLQKRGRLPEIHLDPLKNSEKFWLIEGEFVAYLDVLNVEITGSCNDEALPHFGMNENYTLALSDPRSDHNLLSSESMWGILRGLETFSQMIYLRENQLVINLTTIEDYPRFPHRGLLLDTARHFLPLYSIFQTLDTMAYNKFNVFHWHIVDDHSFPYKSVKYPELSDKGAFHPVSKVYEQFDIKRVIEYARERGIRVIPEFDTPGHTRSWGVSHPELLVPFYDDHGPTGDLGPMNPTQNSTYAFVANLFDEIFQVFPDDYFHMGGDEVEFDCWSSNPQIKQFMNNFNITTYEQLEAIYIQKVVNILQDLKAKPLVWEEVYLNGAELPDSAIVQVWRDDRNDTLDKLTRDGYFGLFSSCWYLDHLSTGGDWKKFYNCDPYNFVSSEDQRAKIIGGEACMWAENVSEYNLVPRLWPRASAIAEKLWSSQSVNDTEHAKSRLEEHTCRMNHRGIAAQPANGPGVCL